MSKTQKLPGKSWKWLVMKAEKDKLIVFDELLVGLCSLRNNVQNYFVDVLIKYSELLLRRAPSGALLLSVMERCPS